MTQQTPWGASQQQTTDAPGIVFHSTASHGGFHLDGKRQAAFVAALPRFSPWAGGAWYEEDCDACAVVIVFNGEFSESAVFNAIRQVRGMATTDPSSHWVAVVAFVDSRNELLGFVGKGHKPRIRK